MIAVVDKTQTWELLVAQVAAEFGDLPEAFALPVQFLLAVHHPGGVHDL
ncbi:MAG: hypothetical protein QUV07_02350 [Cyanobium sp. CZS 25K]|nr:hypothetical protein [Cyanobium sp. CZS25K]